MTFFVDTRNVPEKGFRPNSERSGALRTRSGLGRAASSDAVRNQARCLIDRVGGLGAGAAAAAKRRSWALLEEARMSKERNAHQLCLAQGHRAHRRGQFML